MWEDSPQSCWCRSAGPWRPVDGQWFGVVPSNDKISSSVLLYSFCISEAKMWLWCVQTWSHSYVLFMSTNILKNSFHLLCVASSTTTSFASPNKESIPFLRVDFENLETFCFALCTGLQSWLFWSLVIAISKRALNYYFFPELWNNLEKLFEKTCSQITKQWIVPFILKKHSLLLQ